MSIKTATQNRLRNTSLKVILLMVGVLMATAPAWAFRAEEGSEAGRDAKPHAHDAFAPSALQQVVEKDEVKGVSLRPRTPALHLQAMPALAHAKVNWNVATGAASLLTGIQHQTSGDPVEAAKAFLVQHKGLFSLHAPEKEMHAHRVQIEDNGGAHVRFNQTFQGLPVLPSELIVHIDEHGNLYQVNGEYIPDGALARLSLAPEITAAEALGLAQQQFADKPSLEVEQHPKLSIYIMNEEAYLVYHVIVSFHETAGDVGKYVFYVDAHTGAIVDVYNNIQHIGAPTSNGAHTAMTGAVLNGEGGATINVTGWRDDTNSAYYLYDKDKKFFVYNVASSGYPDNCTYAHRATADWGVSDRHEMSLASAFAATQDVFTSIFGRNSFDGSGAYARANVHQGTNYVNAYWDGRDFHFGDGDGSRASELGVLDIAAHEYGHAWTTHTSGLIYRNESGALNESFSDILGAIVEFAAQQDDTASYPSANAGKADWLMGEDSWLSTTALRDMRDPHNTSTVGSGRQPARYLGPYWYHGSGDNGGVHYNSGVQNKLFYLLTEGGAGDNDGIPYNFTGLGIGTSRQIAFRANTYYMTSSSTHQTALTSWVSAANDINPSYADTVFQALRAVGIVNEPSASDIDYDFEAATLPADWSTSGDADWSLSSSVSRTGAQSIKSGDIGSNQTSVLTLSKTIAADAWIGFYVKVSSERAGDYIMFAVDGVTRLKLSGSTGWRFLAFPVSAGAHTLTWTYDKDAYSTGGDDCIWLDDVAIYTPGTDLGDSSLAEAIDNTSLVITSGGDGAWMSQTAITHDNEDAAQSGAISHRQTTTMNTTLNGAGVLSFWWKVSSEANYDMLKLYVDNTLVDRIHGDVDWTQVTHDITTAGVHTVKWEYYKDSTVSDGDDAGWVDQVEWSGSGASTLPTVTTTTPSSVMATFAVSGGDVTDAGGGHVVARGICWSTSSAPTILDSRTGDGRGTGAFTSRLSGLQGNTTYYVRAYATNSAGTGYGAEETFTTGSNPTVASFSPIEGATGDSIVITGAGFTSVSQVFFGSVAAQSFTVNSDTSITAVVGAGASGAVGVATAAGVGVSSTTFSYNGVVTAPTISEFMPWAAARNNRIIIVGANFTDASAVTFGGAAAEDFEVVNDNQIRAKIGAGETGVITVTTPTGVAVSPTLLYYTGEKVLRLVWTHAGSGKHAHANYMGASYNGAAILDLTISPKFQSKTVGDFNRDARADIIVRNPANGVTASIKVKDGFRNDGYDVLDLRIPAPWEVFGDGDFNGDRVNDLVATNTQTGEVAVIHMGMNFSKQSIKKLDMNVGPAWELVATGDLSQDGVPDLIFQHDSGSVGAIYLGSDFTRADIKRLNTTVPPAWRVVGAWDFNNDGRLDLIARNSSTFTMAAIFLENDFGYDGYCPLDNTWGSWFNSGWDILAPGEVF